MTNNDILQIAMTQSAIEAGCNPEDFANNKNKIVISQHHPSARKYFSLPFFCNLISYGSNIVASVDEKIYDFVSEYITDIPTEHCFETPRLYLLTEELKKYGQMPCYMSEYFLPDLTILQPPKNPYQLKVLEPQDFAHLYTKEWHNALCEKRKELDMLAIAAYDDNTLIGLAGVSADCETMWQIGVDVLPQYRKQGVAAALTTRLAYETLERGKVPFYCCTWANLGSIRNAIKSGFRPAWIEFTATDMNAAMNLTKNI